MYDVKMEGDQPPLEENKELTVLRTIIDEGSCDASTQTINLGSEGHFTRFSSSDDKPYEEINERAHRPHSTSKKSSFRLLIVTDDPESDALNDSSLRLSFDEEHKSGGQSFRVLVASNEWNGKNGAVVLSRPSRTGSDVTQVCPRCRDVTSGSGRSRRNNGGGVWKGEGN